MDDTVGMPQRWGLILAGGEGLRLRPLTRAVMGDARPKQFCPVLGVETMLERTRRRAALAIPPARTLVALTRSHQRFYQPLIAGMPSHCALVQPQERGTAPAILYGLLRIAALAPAASVAILPSDHYVSDDDVFMEHVRVALDVVEARPDRRRDARHCGCSASTRSPRPRSPRRSSAAGACGTPSSWSRASRPCSR